MRDVDPEAFIADYFRSRPGDKCSDSPQSRDIRQRAEAAREDYKRRLPVPAKINAREDRKHKYQRRLANNRRSAEGAKVFAEVLRVETASALHAALNAQASLAQKCLSLKNQMLVAQQENTLLTNKLAALERRVGLPKSNQVSMHNKSITTLTKSSMFPFLFGCRAVNSPGIFRPPPIPMDTRRVIKRPRSGTEKQGSRNGSDCEDFAPPGKISRLSDARDLSSSFARCSFDDILRLHQGSNVAVSKLPPFTSFASPTTITIAPSKFISNALIVPIDTNIAAKNGDDGFDLQTNPLLLPSSTGPIITPTPVSRRAPNVTPGKPPVYPRRER